MPRHSNCLEVMDMELKVGRLLYGLILLSRRTSMFTNSQNNPATWYKTIIALRPWKHLPLGVLQMCGSRVLWRLSWIYYGKFQYVVCWQIWQFPQIPIWRQGHYMHTVLRLALYPKRPRLVTAFLKFLAMVISFLSLLWAPGRVKWVGEIRMETSDSYLTWQGLGQPMIGVVHSVNKNTLPLSRMPISWLLLPAVFKEKGALPIFSYKGLISNVLWKGFSLSWLMSGIKAWW